MNFKTIAKDIIVEDTIKKSRFICHLKHVESEEEARAYIAQIKKEHYKANHSCSAMIIGEQSEIKRSSDDGEPSGTAGIPILNVLEKKELTDVVAVVTRYFGGIKLGTGGLIRAYSNSVAHAIDDTGIVEIRELEGVEIELSYSQYQSFPSFLSQRNLQELDTEFSDKILTKVFLRSEYIEDFLNDLTEFYNGNISVTKAGYRTVAIPIS